MSFTRQDFIRIEKLVDEIQKAAKDMGVKPEFLLKVIDTRILETDIDRQEVNKKR